MEPPRWTNIKQVEIKTGHEETGVDRQGNRGKIEQLNSEVNY